MNFKASICCLILIIFSTLASAQATTIFPFGSQWKFLVTTSEPASWKTASYSDASWPEGAGQLGYGDNDEATIIGYGDNANCRNMTTYFRKTVTISDPGSYTFTGSIKRDDGARVYVNGTEVFNTNLPAGSITWSTPADPFAEDDGVDGQIFSIPSSVFINGSNVIAVEVHQYACSSTDLSFDLELKQTVGTNQPPSVSITSPTNNATAVAGSTVTIQAVASDGDGSISKVEFYAGIILLGQVTATPYTYSYTNVPEGTFALTAKAYDNQNAVTTSGAITLTVTPQPSETSWLTSGNSGISSTQFVGTTDDNPIVFRSNNIERARISNAGNLLLGTSTETNGYKLQVSGDTYLDGTTRLGSLSTDPTDANGAVYYNSTSNQFRSYRNGAWTNFLMSGDAAPISGSNNYIQNQTATAQVAGFNINGYGTLSRLYANNIYAGGGVLESGYAHVIKGNVWLDGATSIGLSNAQLSINAKSSNGRMSIFTEGTSYALNVTTTRNDIPIFQGSYQFATNGQFKIGHKTTGTYTNDVFSGMSGYYISVNGNQTGGSSFGGNEVAGNVYVELFPRTGGWMKVVSANEKRILHLGSTRVLYFPNADGVLSTGGAFKFGNLSAAPTTPENGWTYYNTTSNKPQMYSNGVWKNILMEGDAAGGGTSSGWSLEGNEVTTPSHFIGTKNSQPLVFKTSDTEALRITPSGQVGIGTSYVATNFSDATYKLFVEGNIKARKIKVDAATWADYVFEDSYRLPSLKEVEQFIKRHKHLPEVPSAQEVKEKGLDLGENQAVLLKKIEELTLYIIEQNKKLENLQKEVQELKEKKN